MEKKRIIWMVVAIAVVVFLVGIGVTLLQKKNNNDNFSVKLNSKEIKGLKESDKELPDFKITVRGSFDGTIDKKLLDTNGIKVFEFDAGINNGWRVETNHYVGVRLSDVLDIAIQTMPYSRVKFVSQEYRAKEYEEDQISDDMFLVFERDGKPIRKDGYMSFLAVDYDYSYSVEDVVAMEFKTYEEKVAG